MLLNDGLAVFELLLMPVFQTSSEIQAIISNRSRPELIKQHLTVLTSATTQYRLYGTADGFYRSDDPTNSVKALKEGGQSS